MRRNGAGVTTSPRRDLLVHVALFVIVNAVYLVLAGPEWLWVTAMWSVGLGVHVGIVVRVGAEPAPDATVDAG